jgi:hypothetical protein
LLLIILLTLKLMNIFNRHNCNYCLLRKINGVKFTILHLLKIRIKKTLNYCNFRVFLLKRNSWMMMMMKINILNYLLKLIKNMVETMRVKSKLEHQKMRTKMLLTLEWGMKKLSKFLKIIHIEYHRIIFNKFNQFNKNKVWIQIKYYLKYFNK